MDKAQLCALLRARNIWYEVTEHKAVYNMEELREIPLPYPEGDAKNLFVRDDKKRNYYMITTHGETRVDLKMFRKAHGTRALTFASEADLRELLKITPGSVTPLALLNDHAHRVNLFLDLNLLNPHNIIGVHPLDNTATLWLKTSDLIALLEDFGCEVNVAEI